MAILIDGKAVAARKMEELQTRVDKLKTKGITPSLRVVQVGDDPASNVYIRQKQKACERLGIDFKHDRYTDDWVGHFNYNAFVTGFREAKEINGSLMIQLPLPGGVNNHDEWFIPCGADVDGLSLGNVGLLFKGAKYGFRPCTAAGIIELLKAYDVPLAGKHAVVVGRSNIVGKPVSMLLLNEDCTVTICHSKTENLFSITRQADILIVAAGKPNLIDYYGVKPGAAVIDVGINRVDGKLCGDVDFEGVSQVAGWITPVPGGVGPMTVAMLMENVVFAAEMQGGTQ